jgi:serine phosphatase RsbU (regulator of sigma subunit)
MYKSFLLLFFTLLLLIKTNCIAQDQHYVDSLTTKLKSLRVEKKKIRNYKVSLKDSTEAVLLDALALEHLGNDPNAALDYATQCLELSKQIGYKIGIGHGYYGLGLVNQYNGDYIKANKLLEKSLSYYNEMNSEKNIGYCYNAIGICYENIGNYPLALNSYFSCLQIMEKIGNKMTIAAAYNNIGNINTTLKNTQEALKYHFASLRIKKELGDKRGIADSKNNIAGIYADQHIYTQALKLHFECLKIREEIQDKAGIAISHLNIGNGYMMQHNYVEALKNIFTALKIQEELGNKTGIASSYSVIGECNIKLKKHLEAAESLKKGLILAKETRNIELLSVIYENLSKLDSAQGNSNKALANYKLYITYRDSLLNNENIKKTVSMQMNHDFAKKDAETKAIQERKDAIALKELQRQRAVRNGFVVGFTLVLLLAGFIFRNYKQKQKANLLLEEKNIAISSQKEVIETQKKIVEVKQKQIVDSINYAKRIQKSILIPEQSIQQHLPNSFVLFIPRDIVSGDFYWFHQHGNQSIVVCADCTGHGVPGAFLSMVGSTLLNEIVIQKQITDPANIMKLLAAGVSDTLKHKEKDEIDMDGMDISICTFKNKEVHFAAANNPVYVVNQNGLMEIEPQVNSINGIFEMNTDEKIESITLSPEAGSMVYLSTDGFADQPGQKTNKKLYSAGFEKLLTQIHQLPLHQQKEKLATFFIEWKGNLKQHDDILVMGVRV